MYFLVYVLVYLHSYSQLFINYIIQ